MGNSGKTIPLVKKILIAAAITIIVLSVTVFVVKKTGLFVYLIELFAGSYTNMTVEIGGIDFHPEGNKIFITDVSVSGREKDDIRINLPTVEISSSLSGLLAKNIHEINVSKPSVYLPVRKMKLKASKGGKIDLPFKKMVISEASVALHVDADNVFHINTINLSFVKNTGKNPAYLAVTALISELDSQLKMEAEIDMDKPAVNRGNIRISARNFNTAKKYAPALKSSEIRGTVDLRVDASRKQTDTEDTIEWSSISSLRGVIFRSRSLAINLKDKDLALESKGTYDLNRSIMKIDLFRTQLSKINLLTLQGTVKDMLSEKREIHVAAESSNIPIQDVQAIISGPHTDWIQGIDTNGIISAHLIVKGKLDAPEIEGETSLSGGTLLWKNMKLQSFAVRLPFTFAGKSLRSTAFDLVADRVIVSGDKKDYLIEKNVSVQGTLEGYTGDHRFIVRNISLNTDFIKTISGSVRISMDDPVSIDADLVYDHIDVKEFSERFLSEPLRKKDFRVKGLGLLKTSLQVTIPEKVPSKVSGTAHLTLTGAGFSSSDETVIGEGIEMKTTSVFESTLPFSQVNFRLDSEATGFELLIGKFYGSFKDRGLSLFAAGRYTKADGSVRITESRLNLSRTGSIQITGTLSEVVESPFLDADIQINGFSNSEAFNFFVRDTYQEQLPILSRIRIDGESTARLLIKGDLKKFSARGDINVTDMNIAADGSANAVRGIHLSLPVDLTYPEAPETQEAETFGYLRIKDISWSGVNLKDIEVYPSVHQNAIILKEDAEFPIMGGDMVLKNIFYGDILSPERELRLSVDIRNIDLDRASAAFGLPRFSGRLSGAIPLVRLARNNLFTGGEIILEVFGGNVKIGNLSIDNVFSPITSVKSSIEFEEIDLGQLTSTFDFGHISGVIRGKIEDFVIVNGQAEGFHAFAESYKKKGVTQKINVEALKKISILGTGASPSVLDRGIYRFFREYGYEKLGFRASLKNDNLLLLGIENEGSRGYLVKGGVLPPKVDVINYTQNISFQEMVRRLKRIKQAERQQ